jgi:hypothetical protein
MGVKYLKEQEKEIVEMVESGKKTASQAAKLLMFTDPPSHTCYKNIGLEG